MQQALVPQLLTSFNQHKVISNTLVILGGTILLCVLAQISLPLPFTPVPITGQTFGVLLMALLLGRQRALASFTSYFILGAIGLPVFALGRKFILGPTTGYVLGMFLSTWIVGTLADKGFTKTFGKCLLAALLSSGIIYAFGLMGLAFFIPTDKLLMAGMLPFLPGDIIKTLLACSLVKGMRTGLKRFI